MTCQSCTKEPFFEAFCRDCFLQRAQKRIRKEIRTHALITKGDTLRITDPLGERTVSDIVQGMPVIISKTDGKAVLLWSMDDEIDYFLNGLFAGQKTQELGHGGNIKLFLSLRDKDVEALARAYGLPYTQQTRKYKTLLDTLEAKYPEMRFSLMKSIDAIRKMAP